MGRVRDLVETLRECSDAELRTEWRRYTGAEGDGAAAVTAALAAASEARRRVDGTVFDDDLLHAGVELCRGHIVSAAPRDADEIAAIPACLAALEGLPFHVITLDDAGAVRIAGRLSARLAPLGLAVAAVTEAAELAERRDSYAADVTVASWEQFGYDYLRDNLAWKSDDRAGRGNGWAFLTEADHLLLDLEARILFITAHDATLARIPLREYLATDRSDESLVALSRGADPGAVTVVTEDAVRGRGAGSVDTGGPAPTVLIAGHAMSRRTDDRLCALAAHPTVPGECCFFVSDQDEVVKPAHSRASRMLDRLTGRVERRKGGMPAGRMLTQIIETVQDAWERHAARQRSMHADYDAVEREQREQMYAQRDALLGADRPVVRVRELIRAVIDRHVREYPQPAELLERLATLYPVTVQAADVRAALDDRAATLEHDALAAWQAQVDRYGNEVMGTAAQDAELAILDRAWSEHLTELDRLREHVGEPSSRGPGNLDGTDRQRRGHWRPCGNALRSRPSAYCSVSRSQDPTTRSDRSRRSPTT